MQVGLVAAQARARRAGVGHPPRRSTAHARRRSSSTSSRSRSTADQERAIAEITHDMAGAAPMHRLLQGDVGSGKTVVALAALLDRRAGRLPGCVHGADRSARRAALPRVGEAARRAHGRRATGSLLGDRPVRVELLTNRTTAAERRRIAQGLAGNEVDILVGTHALLYGDAEFTQPRPRGDRRAAPLRRRAARAAARRRPTATSCPTCW